MAQSFSQSLLAWYQQNGRDLPWRDRVAPYTIWIAEIMLQQTRVDTVIPYYLRWMDRFPTVEDLARVELGEVMSQWEGLGYYRRAINMHKAAAIILSEHSGQLPRTVEQLEKLPGIGKYTAAAIAAIAFDQDVLAMDGNLRRVFSRVFEFGRDPSKPRAERQLRNLARDLLPSGQAGAFNQALMDLGSMVCLPRIPECTDCPVRAFCRAHKSNRQHELPVRKARARIPQVAAVAAVLQQNEKVLLGRRSESAMLARLWEYPGGRVESGESDGEALQREIFEELGVEIRLHKQIGAYRHSYTHFKVCLNAYHCEIIGGQPKTKVHSELQWVHIHDLGEYPMGKIDRLISNDLADRPQA